MNIVYMVGVFDAVMIAGLGAIAAMLMMMGKDTEMFWKRIVPSVAILVGTSFAAGIVMMLAKWMGA